MNKNTTRKHFQTIKIDFGNSSQCRTIMKEVIINAARTGDIATLQKCKDDNVSFNWTEDAMVEAAEFGQVHVLQWYLTSGLTVKFNARTVENGRTSLIENRVEIPWSEIYTSNYAVYNDDAIDLAARNGHVNVLDWFDKSGLEFKYTYLAIDWATENGHINVLEWFKNSKHKFTYSKNAIDNAVKNSKVNYVTVLDWFRVSGMKIKCSDTTKTNAKEWFGKYNL